MHFFFRQSSYSKTTHRWTDWLILRRSRDYESVYRCSKGTNCVKRYSIFIEVFSSWINCKNCDLFLLYTNFYVCYKWYKMSCLLNICCCFHIPVWFWTVSFMEFVIWQKESIFCQFYNRLKFWGNCLTFRIICLMIH